MTKGFLQEYYPFFLVGLFAVVIDYLLLHYPNPIAVQLGYNIIPEVTSYFVVKYFVVVGAYFLIKEVFKREGRLSSAFYTGILGSLAFGLYYFAVRPIVFTPDMTIVIGLVHGIAIFLAVLLAEEIRERS